MEKKKKYIHPNRERAIIDALFKAEQWIGRRIADKDFDCLEITEKEVAAFLKHAKDLWQKD